MAATLKQPQNVFISGPFLEYKQKINCHSPVFHDFLFNLGQIHLYIKAT